MSHGRAGNSRENVPTPPDPAQREVTSLLDAAAAGDGAAAERLLPLVYEELRSLARARMAGERPGNTLQPTALVHEAYLRLVGGQARFAGRGQFFASAALAMRRILVERARARGRLKRGGGRARVALEEGLRVEAQDPAALLALDEALARLEARDERKAKIVMLRYFAGLTVEETGACMDLAPSTIKSEWAYARAWLWRELSGGAPPEERA